MPGVHVDLDAHSGSERLAAIVAVELAVLVAVLVLDADELAVSAPIGG